MSAFALSSHCSKVTRLAAMVSPPMMCSITRAGSNRTISSALSGILAAFFKDCSKVAIVHLTEKEMIRLLCIHQSLICLAATKQEVMYSAVPPVRSTQTYEFLFSRQNDAKNIQRINMTTGSMFSVKTTTSRDNTPRSCAQHEQATRRLT